MYQTYDYGPEFLQGSFRSIVGAGYKTLEFVLIDLHKGKPSRDLLLSLLDMLVDGSFQPSNMVIQVHIWKINSCLNFDILHLLAFCIEEYDDVDIIVLTLQWGGP
jgi:hypothetical protein